MLGVRMGRAYGVHQKMTMSLFSKPRVTGRSVDIQDTLQYVKIDQTLMEACHLKLVCKTLHLQAQHGAKSVKRR
jgi:hypothetical protein